MKAVEDFISAINGESLPVVNGGLLFEQAFAAARLGYKITRMSWKESGKYVVAQNWSSKVPSDKIWNRHNRLEAENLGGEIVVSPYCVLRTESKELAMGWLPSSEDMFARDWYVYDVDNLFNLTEQVEK